MFYNLEVNKNNLCTVHFLLPHIPNFSLLTVTKSDRMVSNRYENNAV